MNESDKLLFEVLKEYQIFEQVDLKTYVHAIIDIRGAIETINGLLITIDLKKNKEEVLDIIWSIREEFRHIDYHLKDAKLTE